MGEKKQSIKFDDVNDWLRIKNLSETTIRHYNVYFQKLDPKLFHTKGLLKWLKRYNNEVARAALTNFLKYIKQNKQDFPPYLVDIALNFEIPKKSGRKKQRVLNVINRGQVHYIAKCMKNSRDRYMVLLSFYCGLRSSELLQLRISNFDFEKKLVKVIGKGNKERTIPVVPELLEKIAKYINSELEKDHTFDKLFPLSGRYWRKTMASVSKKAIGKAVHPHLLRHSCGTYMYQRGMDIRAIQEFLGHSSIQTTQIYTHLNTEELSEKVEEAFKI